LVNRNDGARTLHPDHVLNGAADTEGQVQLRRYGLAGAADLALHGEPAFVADWPRGRDFSAESFRKSLSLRNIFRRLDATADRDDQRRLCQIDSGFCFL